MSVLFCDQTVTDFLFEGGTEDFSVNTLQIRSLKGKHSDLVIAEEKEELVGVHLCCRTCSW